MKLGITTRSRKGQVAVFVIVALLVVAGIVVYFVVRGEVSLGDIPANLVPVFDYYQSCVESEAKVAIQLAGAQGGRVDAGIYIPGSEYAPFSSQLNFLGSPVPYWYYIAGNGLIKENKPSKSEMEQEIAEYIQEGLEFCRFGSFLEQGYDVKIGSPLVNVVVEDGLVKVDVAAEVSVVRGEESARKTEHKIEIDSKLGKFYDLASEIYDKQKEEAFLENYAVDTLYLYAPVEGVEIQCGPKIWSTQKVMQDLKEALAENFARIKFKGNYYELQDEDNEYFVLDKNVDEVINVMYSTDWPTKIEISGEGVDDEVLMAEAVGTQAGLGAMGFCYVPYHFVYDVSFPTMIQIYDNENLFQFPVAVIIDNNVQRKANLGEGIDEEEEFDLCQFKEQEIEVNIFDINLNRVDANLSFECFDKRCRLGESADGNFRGFAPQCVNGFLQLRAEGFADKSQLMSTNRESFADVILEREYELDVELEIGGGELEGSAVASFTRDDGRTTSVALPEFNKAKLIEGNYDILVYVYGNSSLTLPATTEYKCVEVPKQGLLSAFFGATEENCFEITLPATKVDFALVGGGKTSTYILEDELKKGKMKISVSELPRPNSLDQLQQNFELFETRRVDLSFDES